MNYAEDSRFSGYVFEESYVLGVHVGIDWAVIELDVCLSQDHPNADQKSEGDWAAFRPAQLWFKQAKVDFRPSGVRPTLDPDGSWDYGSIDRFELRGRDEYLLEGDFGRVCVTAAEVFMLESFHG